MKTNSFNCLTPAPPRDDGSIAGAFAEIDRKLNEWSATVQRVQSVLASKTRELLERESTSSLSVGAPIEEGAPAAVECASVVAEEPVECSEPVAEVAQSTLIADPGSVTDTTDVQDDQDYELAEAAETPVSKPSNPDDDESLLSGLSPEAANAIRVQRRLLEGVKTLRQLVEEYGAGDSRSGQARGQKRSWWSRGKG